MDAPGAEEPPTKRIAPEKTTEVAGQEKAQSEFPEHFHPALLKPYYDHVFPFEDMSKWLSYGNGCVDCLRLLASCLVVPTDPSDPNVNEKDKRLFKWREFSFTLADDIYLRFRSYDRWQDWRADVLKKIPHKMDIGAVFNFPPNNRAGTQTFLPEQKEIVVDIDISDYDDVRYCCQGASVCSKCWPLMACGIECLDRALREDFGFEHLLWVFSGRRGIHCWVCDEDARSFTNDERSSIASSEGTNRKVNLGTWPAEPCHLLSRSFDICSKYFAEYILEQGIMPPARRQRKKKPGAASDDEEELDEEALEEKRLAESTPAFLSGRDAIGDFVNLIDDSLEAKTRGAGRTTLRSLVTSFLIDDGATAQTPQKRHFSSLSPQAKWEVLTDRRKFSSRGTLSDWLGTRDHRFQAAWRRVLAEIVFTFMYPRLDVEVTRQRHHLLKSPWVVHPKTGAVCVPLPVDGARGDYSVAQAFDCDTKLDQVIGELKDVQEARDAPPSLQPYLRYFSRSFVAPLLKKTREKRREESARSMDF